MFGESSALVIIAFQIAIIALFNFGPFSSDIEILGLNLFPIKHLKKSYNKSKIGLETGALFQTFPN